ncbi:hypothetical protein JW796_02425 [Candidatus Dojkabacteria bacterium]|nr:hypothetical protein [Candidatus Dojkabacteria bacterium]
MGQKIVDAGKCDYCRDRKKAVYYTGLYSQDEDLMEIHCNTCRASWEADGTPRAIPSQSKLEQLGVFSEVVENSLPFTPGTKGEWFCNYVGSAEALG